MPNFAERMAAAFEDEMRKIAQGKISALKPKTMKTLGLMAAGGVATEAVHRAEHDRRMGRQMRLQSGGGYY